MSNQTTELFNNLINANEAAKMCGISRSSVINLEKRGKFPVRVILTSGRFSYKKSEVELWIQHKIDLRDRINQPGYSDSDTKGEVQ